MGDGVKKIIYKKTVTEYPEHDWYRTASGEIDDMAFEYEYHNGPACKRCHYSFCIHCGDGSLDDGPCVVEDEEYCCPYCNNDLYSVMVLRFRNSISKCKYCPFCGKEINYSWEE